MTHRTRLWGSAGALFIAVSSGAGSSGCSSSSTPNTSMFAGSSGTSGSSGASGSSASGSVLGNRPDAGLLGLGTVCAACDQPSTCAQGQDTTISGKVYDPAGKNPLFNVSVFIPMSPLPKFTQGASCGSCQALYPPIIFASAVTDASGSFTIKGAPAGAAIPLVVQNGKWRRSFTVTTTACVDNPQPDKSLRLPGKAADGDLPDIAISTGAADSLECLPLRVGVDASEYVPGSSSAGHFHVFTGHGGAATAGTTPKSPAALWDSLSDLSANDAVLLSCEGSATALSPAYQQFMVDYTSAGGRVFASHYQYAWFSTGPFATKNLATWTPGSQQGDDTMAYPATPVTSLTSGQPFPEGLAFQTWLKSTVNALNGNTLPVYYARHNADVTASNPASQPWLVLDTSSAFAPGATEYFTFDTPVAAASASGGAADGGSGACGRVAYSSLHVSGGAGANQPPSVAPDYPVGGVATVPGGCAIRDLTPQEKALEFMLFDLTSCLIPVGGSPLPPSPPR